MSEQTQKFIVTLWDGDIYILDGYSSAEELEAKLTQTERVAMPNGDIIKTSAISKIQSRESYSFQKNQHSRHKKGQWISKGKWFDVGGEIGNADLKSITGKMKSIEAPKSSTAKQLPKG